MNPITPAGQLAQAAALRSDQLACSYMGRKFTFAELMKLSEDCARSFAAIGVHEGCRVMLHMPLIPQALSCFYGINMLGAAAVILDSVPPDECIGAAEIRALVTTDTLYGSLENIHDLPTTIVARPQDTMGTIKKLSYIFTEGRSAEKINDDYGLLSWDAFMLGGRAFRGEHSCTEDAERSALILYGSETISLSNADFLSSESDTPIIRLHHDIMGGKCPELDL